MEAPQPSPVLIQQHTTCLPDSGSRVSILDGLRGLAIALVMAHHFFMDSMPADNELDRTVFRIVHGGWCGVDLFFVLSGYLITGILLSSKGSKGYFKNFYARRTVRIFPLYYVTLFVFFVLLPKTNHPEILDYVKDSRSDQAWFWAYLTNIRIAMRGDFYVEVIPSLTWSLAIEEQFYLAWPLVVFLCSRSTLMRICIGLIIGALALRAAFALTGIHWVVSYVLTPARVDCLAIGSFLALFFRGSYRPQVVIWARRTILAMAVFVIWIGIRKGTLARGDELTYTLGFTGIGILFGSLLVLCLTTRSGSLLSCAVDNTFLRTLGKYSYALYLCHGPVGTAVRVLYNPRHQPLLFESSLPRTLIYALLTGLASLMVAFLSWHLFEKHFLKLKRHF